MLDVLDSSLTTLFNWTSNSSNVQHMIQAGSMHVNPLDQNKPLQTFYVICLAFQSVFGTIGNILVMGAVCIVPALRTTGNFFIINLSLADLIVTLVTQPGNIVGALLGEQWWSSRPIMCSIVATMCAAGCISSTWNICMISVNRYVMIAHYEYYDTIYCRRNTILMCLGVWLVIYTIELPNHLGWGDNRFSVVFFMCTFANHVHSYALFYILVGVAIPVIISFLCYLGIYLKVKNSNLVRQRILSQKEQAKVGGKEEKKTMSHRKFRENVKVARALFRVYVIFLIMWAPVAVVILMGKGTQVDYVWYILTVLLAHGNSSINCVVYAASLEHFREGYFRLLGLTSRRTRVSGAHTHSSYSNYTNATLPAKGVSPPGKETSRRLSSISEL